MMTNKQVNDLKYKLENRQEFELPDAYRHVLNQRDYYGNLEKQPLEFHHLIEIGIINAKGNFTKAGQNWDTSHSAKWTKRKNLRRREW